jgi:hypothetical protein
MRSIEGEGDRVGTLHLPPNLPPFEVRPTIVHSAPDASNSKTPPTPLKDRTKTTSIRVRFVASIPPQVMATKFSHGRRNVP